MAAKAARGALRVRKSADRGYADHDWLKSYHTFSFAEYHDSKFDSFGALRVINEDTVAAGHGFPTHGHRDFEIFSYVLSGELGHTDSMGNKEVLRAGDVQYTTAGSGISHSEYNAHKSHPVRFLQMWVKPHTMSLPPAYQTGHFPVDTKLNNLKLLISPDASEGSLKIQQDCRVYASVLEVGKTVEHAFASSGGGSFRRGYLHYPITASNVASLVVNDERLSAGDGLFVENTHSINVTADGDAGAKAEFILFDLA